MKNIFILFLSIAFLSMQSFGQSNRQSFPIFEVTFTSNWTQTAHPHPSGSLPGNAHWSKLVGTSHNNNIVFFEMGGIATQGVENIAEQGSNTVFFSEVDAAINAGNAWELIDGDGLSTAEGEIIVSFEPHEDFPFLSLLSMIAPSPDWMIAINSIPLMDGAGEWIDEINIDLYPYDAGTDSGVDYTSPNNDTNPQEPISSLQGVAPFSNEIIGTINIKLFLILGSDDVPVNETALFPNPANETVTVSNTGTLQTVSIYNVLGTEVLQVNDINTNSKQIDISALPSGVYLVKAQNDTNDGSVKRLVKL